MADLLRQTPIDYELIRANRYELLFPTELGIESWMVQKASRPKFKVNVVDVPFMNTKFFVPGQYEWEAMDIEMIQTIGPSTSQKMMEWLRLMAESLTGRMGYAKGYMKDLILTSLDPTGVAVEQWILQNCFITSIDFGENDHSSDALQMIKFTIQPQYCIQSF